MKKVVTIKVEGKEWQEAQDKAFNKLNKTAKIDGFRPGKAPRKVFEKNYGISNILTEAMDNMIDAKYMEAVTKENIMPLVQPKLDVVKLDENEFEATITCIIAPEVKLGDYKNLKVKKEKAKVSKEEIEHEIEHILEHYAEVAVKESDTLEDGDISIIDFEGFKDGVAFEGGKGENYSLEIGSHTFIPGFEEQLVGMKKGEEKEIKVTFPEDYMAENLKGAEVTFKVKLHDIKTRVVPELNKEFFEDLDMEGVTTKEELEKAIEEEILVQKENDIENKYVDALLEAAAKNMEIEIDEELVEDEAHHMYHQFIERMAMQGVSEEMYLQYTNTTHDNIVNEMKPEAENRIKYRYLLEEIIKAEKIDATDKEAEDYAKDIATKYNVDTDVVIKDLGGLEMLKYELRMKKAIDCLKTNN